MLWRLPSEQPILRFDLWFVFEIYPFKFCKAIAIGSAIFGLKTDGGGEGC